MRIAILLSLLIDLAQRPVHQPLICQRLRGALLSVLGSWLFEDFLVGMLPLALAHHLIEAPLSRRFLPRPVALSRSLIDHLLEAVLLRGRDCRWVFKLNVHTLPLFLGFVRLNISR